MELHRFFRYAIEKMCKEKKSLNHFILKSILENYGIQKSFDLYINKIKDVDYSNNYFSLSGGGKTKLRRILKFKLGLISKSDLLDSDIKFLEENNISII